MLANVRTKLQSLNNVQLLDTEWQRLVEPAYVPLRHDHRKLGAGFVTLPQMTGRRVGMPFVLSTPTPTLALRFRQNNGPTKLQSLNNVQLLDTEWQRLVE
jgi:hypothetical protein